MTRLAGVPRPSIGDVIIVERERFVLRRQDGFRLYLSFEGTTKQTHKLTMGFGTTWARSERTIGRPWFPQGDYSMEVKS